jgi:hypothetical protein
MRELPGQLPQAGIRIPAKRKSAIDFTIKTADRFSHENRDPVSRTVRICNSKTGFQSTYDSQMKTADRFYRENRDLIVL